MAELPEMKDFIEWVRFQNSENLFERHVPLLYENKVRKFYHNFKCSKDGLYLTSQVNGVIFSLMRM